MFDRVFQLIRKEDISLFVGAGLSLKAGYPSGHQLVETICDDIKNELSVNELSILKHQPLPFVAEKYIQIRNGSRNSLIQLLTQAFTRTPQDLSNQTSIASIPHFKNIFTTNFDSLLENAYHNQCNLIIEDANCPYIDNRLTNIFKIHGDLNRPDSILITQNDYTRYFDSLKNPIMWNLVKSTIATKSTLFLGYSFEDSNIESIFTKLFDSIGNNHKELFLIAPQLDNIKRNHLNRYGINYIDSTAEHFLESLLSDLKEHIKDDYEKKIVSTDTFNAFCNIHGIAISISIKKDKNEINKIGSIDGKRLATKITFSVGQEISDKIRRHEFHNGLKELANISGLQLSNNPSLKITKDQLLNFRHTENDIVFHHKDDIKALYLVQVPNKKGKVSLITPKGKLFQNISFEIYGKGSSILIRTQLPLYSYDIEMWINKDNIQFQATPQFDNYYSNKAQAVYWTELLLALCEGGEFTLRFENNKEHKVPLPYTQEGIDLYSKMIEYYNVIAKIEELIREPFAYYECYTQDKFTTAKKSTVLCN